MGDLRKLLEDVTNRKIAEGKLPKGTTFQDVLDAAMGPKLAAVARKEREAKNSGALNNTEGE